MRRRDGLGILRAPGRLPVFEQVLHRVTFHLDVTVRNAEEVHALEAKVAELEKKVHDQDVEISRALLWAPRYLDMVDQLKQARRLMEDAGLDTRWINL